jgi:hypothetical protein
MERRRSWSTWLPIAIAVGATSALGVDHEGITIGPSEAYAIVGRPLTPVSYAGVARRTARRTTAVAATAAVTTAAVATTAVAAARIATLPPGCVRAGASYTCGAAVYEAVYDGPTVVYVQR